MPRNRIWEKLIRKLLVVTSCIYVMCTALATTGLVWITFNGFGVDSSGRLYVGEGNRISVYENSQLLYKIQNNTGRGYVFTVQENDSILLASGSHICRMNLHGENIFPPMQDEGSNTTKKLEKSKFDGFSRNGDVYSTKQFLGYISIYRGEEVIYRMPLLNYVVKIGIIVSTPCFFLSIFLLIMIRKHV